MIKVFKRWYWSRYVIKAKKDIIRLMDAVRIDNTGQVEGLAALMAALLDVINTVHKTLAADIPEKVKEQIIDFMLAEFDKKLLVASPDLMANRGEQLVKILSPKMEGDTIQ